MRHHSAAFEQQLSELLDGRLNAEEAREVREHLATCTECRAQFDAMAAAREMLRAIPAPTAPDGLLADIQRAVAAEMARSVPPTIWERWRTPALGLAAAAAILLAVFTPWQTRNGSENCAVCPTPDIARLAATPDTHPVTDDSSAHDGQVVELAEAPTRASTGSGAAESEMTNAPATGGRRYGRALRSTTSVASEPEVVAEAPAEQPAEASEPQPTLAWAPTPDSPSATASGPVLGEIERPTVVTLGPRTTIEAQPTLAPAAPSDTEVGMATGVVAAMLVDQFVAEHMVQTSSTMLSVVTDTPTVELGPVIASDEDEAGNFELCFTDAMRRALTESENRLP